MVGGNSSRLHVLQPVARNPLAEIDDRYRVEHGVADGLSTVCSLFRRTLSGSKQVCMPQQDRPDIAEARRA